MDDPAFEWRLRLGALPLSLLGARLLVASPLLHGLLRTFLSMWVHESGHAVTAWLCGFPAFPGPWKTPVAAARSWPFALALAAGLAYVSFKAYRAQRWGLLAASVALELAQAIGTVLLPAWRAEALYIFGGDGGLFVLGSALMLTFYASAEGPLVQNGLRWGFLAIGAAAFMDGWDTWFSARTDVDRIPFGENEGVGPSDPSRLVDDYGWTVHQLVSRYVSLAVVCGLLLLACYAAGLWAAHREERAILPRGSEPG